MKSIIDLKEELPGLALPDGPAIPILHRVSHKRGARLDLAVILGVVLLCMLSLGLFWGTRIAGPKELSRQQAYAISVEIFQLCEREFIKAAADGSLRFARLGRDDSIIRASGKCTKISDRAMASVFEIKRRVR